MPISHLTACLGLCAIAGFAVGCSTPASTGDWAQADAASVVFDANSFSHDGGKVDAGKADTGHADAVKADAAKSDVDAAPSDAGKDVPDAKDVPTADDAADVDAATDAAVADALAGDADAELAPDATDADASDVDDGDTGSVPAPFGHLCDPCSASSACNEGGATANVCVSSGADGSFCGTACDPADPGTCPDTYACTALTDPVLGATHQCKPDNGVCTCSVPAAIAKLSTPCQVANGTGTCTGTRSCGVSGLGKCTALPAMDEVCNGLDDNCDGKTDEGLCTGNVCLSGQCDAVTGVCSPAPAGTTCDDGNNCTTTDTCSFGTCTGSSTGEANDVAPGAGLAKKSDCDGTSKTQSILAPGSDVDWFNFNASDDTFCNIYPSVRVDQMAGDYDVCVYWACKDGSSDSSIVGCDSGSKVSGGPNGMWGCCSANAGLGAEKIQINTTCSFLGAGDDGGSAWIKVTAHNPKAVNMCGGYTLTWSAASF